MKKMNITMCVQGVQDDSNALESGVVIFFQEDYLSGIGVVVDLEPWLKLAEIEYPVHMLKDIVENKKGFAVIILGELIGSFMHGYMETELPQHQRYRRFVFVERGRNHRNTVFVCDNLSMLQYLFELRVFDKYGTEYLKSVRYDLLVLDRFLNGEQNGNAFSGYGTKLFELFKRCIPR